MLLISSELRKRLILSLFIIGTLGFAAIAFSQVRYISIPFDDAFISYRYADNLARGRGLVYNPGEPVEGYTNFLWVILAAFGIKLGFTPLAFTLALGRASFVGSVVLCAALVHRAVRGRWSDILGLAALAWVIFPSHHASFAGSGLETTFFAAQIVALAAIEHRDDPASLPQPAGKWAWWHGLLPTTIVLTRPDGVLFVGSSLLVTAIVMLKSRWTEQGRGAAIRATAADMARRYWPFVAIMVTYLAWKLYYYGALLPNTYYAKRAYFPQWEAGLKYMEVFVTGYPNVLVLAALCVIAVWLPPHPRLRPLTAWAGLSTLLFAGYVVKAGGDFMHYRFAFEVYPLIAGLAGLGVLSLTRLSVPAAAFAVLLVFIVGRGDPKMETKWNMQDIDIMNEYAMQGARTGPILKEKTPPETILSAELAGTIAYFSDRTTIDMWGLNDRYVAHMPSQGTARGHMKYAPVEYLRERGVNLEVGHPYILQCTQSQRDASKKKKPPHAPLVFIQLDAKECMRTEYLVQTPELTRWFCDHPNDFILDGVTCPK